MANRELIKKRYALATNSDCREMLEELKNVIIRSSSSLKPEVLQGMLMLVAEPYKWVSAYETELVKAKKGIN